MATPYPERGFDDPDRGGAAFIDKGSGETAFGGLSVVAGQQAMHWNGALRFGGGEKASAACYDANGNPSLVSGQA